MLGFVDDGPPYADSYLRRASAALESLPSGAPIVLVGHSNAGLFLPAIAEPLAPRGVSFIFADASIPPIDGVDGKDPADTTDLGPLPTAADTAHSHRRPYSHRRPTDTGPTDAAPDTPDPADATTAPLVPEAVLDQLRAMAVGGILPRWGDWWPDDVTATLYPDTATRERVAAEEPELPIAFYEESSDRPGRMVATSVRLSPVQRRLRDGSREGDRRLHWPVLHIAGEHLHMLVDPARVAAGICELAGKLNPGIAPQEVVDATDNRCYGCAASAVHTDRGAQGLVQKVQWRGPVRVSRVAETRQIRRSRE